MRNGALLRLLCILLVAATSANAQTAFESTLAKMKAAYDRKLPDGTIKESKQVKRWEWFWEPRLTPNGNFPDAKLYYDEVKAVSMRKKSTVVQAVPVWKELGPTAPDLPAESSIWNGIGRVNSFTFSPSDGGKIWIGSAQGGIWKTTNSGGNWTYVDASGFPMFGVSDIAISPSNENIMYVATGDADAAFPGKLSEFPGFSYGVIKSTDGGNTWNTTGLSMELEDNNLVSRLWVDPTNANIVIAATYTGIRKSTDGGISWSLRSSVLAFRDIVANPQNAQLLYATTFAYGGGARIYLSDDAGDSWTDVLTVPEANRIKLAVTKADPKVVGAVASNASTNGLFAIYSSSDYGQNFSEIIPQQNLLGWSSSGNDWQYGGQGFYDLAMEISPTDSRRWFVGGINAWRSTNSGMTWVLSAHWTGSGAPWVHADHHFMKYSSTANVLYTASDGGIARSTDNGVSWRDVSNGLKIQQYYDLSTTDMNSTITLAGAQDNGTARTLNGSTFMHVLDGDGMASAIDRQNPQLFYGSQPNGQFYRSTNQGNSWQFISNASQRGEQSGSWVAPVVVDPTQSGTVYIGYSQLYKSTNSGASFQRISQISVSNLIRHIAVAPSNNQYIYIAYSGAVYYTQDGGNTWSAQPGIGSFIQDIEVHPTNPKRFWVTFGGFVGSNKIVEVNNGQVTNITGSGLPNVPCNTVVFQPGSLNRVYVGTDVGVFFKDEGSSSWEPYGQGMPTSIITDMELLSMVNKLRVSTYGRGIWEVDATQCRSSVPSITVVGSSTACAGDTILLRATNGYAKYQWSNGETGNQIKLSTISETGDYTVTVEDQAGCRNVSLPVSVTIKRAPVKPTISRKGPDTLRSSAIGGITIFRWYFGDSLIEGATSREFSPTQYGYYTVEAENSDGCRTKSEPYLYSNPQTSVSEGHIVSMFTVRPNPVNDILETQLPQGNGRTIEIVSVSGILQFSHEVADGTEIETVNVETLAPGAYVIRIRSGKSLWSSIFIKQ